MALMRGYDQMLARRSLRRQVLRNPALPAASRVAAPVRLTVHTRVGDTADAKRNARSARHSRTIRAWPIGFPGSRQPPATDRTRLRRGRRRDIRPVGRNSAHSHRFRDPHRPA